jgi:hypothetical protein
MNVPFVKNAVICIRKQVFNGSQVQPDWQKAQVRHLPVGCNYCLNSNKFFIFVEDKAAAAVELVTMKCILTSLKNILHEKKRETK